LSVIYEFNLGLMTQVRSSCI